MFLTPSAVLALVYPSHLAVVLRAAPALLLDAIRDFPVLVLHVPVPSSQPGGPWVRHRHPVLLHHPSLKRHRERLADLIVRFRRRIPEAKVRPRDVVSSFLTSHLPDAAMNGVHTRPGCGGPRVHGGPVEVIRIVVHTGAVFGVYILFVTYGVVL